MPGVPSNKACERCKKRHLKCDETRPQCQRCTTAGVECPGYVQMRKFIDQGATVRRRYAPYQENHSRHAQLNDSDTTDRANSPGSRDNGNQQTIGPIRQNTIPFTATIAEGPEQGSLHSSVPSPIYGTKSPVGDIMQTEVDASSYQQTTIAPAPISQNQSYNQISPGTIEQEQRSPSRSNAQSSISPHESASESIHYASYKPVSNQRSPVARLSSGELSQRSEKEEFQDIFSELTTGTEHELSFLIRHFSEVLGPWMDLSDSAKFFAVYVPIRAINNEYLKYAIAALVSKHLGRVKGAKSPAGGGMFSSPATMETYPNSSHVDWFLKAANYYYLAVSHLNASSSDYYTSVSSTMILESPIETVGRWLNLQLAQFGSDTEKPSAGTFSRKAEDMLAVSALLTMYKFLDAPGEHWQSHLKGIKPLFDSLLQIQTNHPDAYPQFSHGARAVFWNFARQDYLASYFNRLPTHLDQENLSLWRAAGISIDEEGNASLANGISGGTNLCQDDLAATSLIWILNKVVNFLAEFKKSQLAQWTGATYGETPTQNPPGQTSQQSPATASTWLKLCLEFQSWFDSVPEPFRPCLRLESPKDLSKLPEISHLPFPEIFYSSTTCTAAVQQYHFGRLALLLNRPPDAVSAPSTAFDRLQGYRELTKEVDHRCREICGIALARPQGGVRIYMVPLLLAVGQCLENPEERQIIVDLLRGVEADLGWMTDDTVQKLQRHWDQ